MQDLLQMPLPWTGLILRQQRYLQGILFTLGNELHFEGNTIKTIIKSQFEDNFIFKRKINLIDGEVS